MPSMPASLDTRCVSHLAGTIWSPGNHIQVSCHINKSHSSLQGEKKHCSCMHGAGSIEEPNSDSFSGTSAPILLCIIWCVCGGLLVFGFGFFLIKPCIIFLKWEPRVLTSESLKGFWEMKVFHLNIKRIWCYPSWRLGLSHQEGAGVKLFPGPAHMKILPNTFISAAAQPLKCCHN